MKKSLKTIGIIMLSLLTVMVGIGGVFNMSLSEVFAEDFLSSYGIPWGEGTVTLTLEVQGDEIAPGVYDDPTPIEGIVFDVYQLWSLTDPEDGAVSIDVKEPFKRVLTESVIQQMTDVGTEVNGVATLPAPTESIRKLAKTTLADLSAVVDVYYETPETDPSGKLEVSLPYGGYLFMPQGSLEVFGVEYTTDPFMVSLPAKTGPADDSNPVGVYSAKVDATPKTELLSHVPSGKEISIGKENLLGEELIGAELTLFRMNEADESWDVIDNWISIGVPKVIEDIEPGIYRLHEDTAPVGYDLANDIYFIINDDYSVYVGTGLEKRPGTDMYILVKTVDLDNGDSQTLVFSEEIANEFLLGEGSPIIMVDEPAITKHSTIIPEGEGEAPHEVITYAITTVIPEGLKDVFQIIDSMEPVLELADNPNFIINLYEGDFDHPIMPPDGVDLVDYVSVSDGVDEAGNPNGRLELKLTFDFTDTAEVPISEELDAILHGCILEFIFDTRIKEGADLSPYASTGGVPNTADYRIDNYYKSTVKPAYYEPEKPKTETPPPNKPNKPESVKTGDSSDYGFYLLLFLAAGAAFLLSKKFVKK